MNTLQDEWEQFSAHVIPEDASKIQKVEMKRAFYAGATAMMTLSLQASSDDLSEDAACMIMENIRIEIEDYFRNGIHHEYEK